MVMGQGQRSMLNFWHAAVDIRDSALLSAAKSLRYVIIGPGCLSVC